MDSLTDEQKARIEKNRQEALRRLEERNKRLMEGANALQLQNVAPSTSSAAAPIPLRAIHFQSNDGFKKPANLSSGAVKQPLKCALTDHNYGGPTKSYNHRPLVKVDFTVMDEQFVKVNFMPFHISVVDTIKSMPNRNYNEQERYWSVRFSDYEPLIAKLRAIRDLNVDVEELPNGVKMVFQDEIRGTTFSQKLAENQTVSLNNIDEKLLSALFPYQKRGVIFGVQKGGRILIADEMGLGKSVQALGIAQKYSAEWPLLIVCPSSVKSAWQNQIQKFLPDVTNVYMIDKGTDVLPRSRSTSIIVIMSYDQMGNRLRELLDHSFYVVIFDESHSLKEMKAKRTKAAIELSKKATRVILLSGTPALSRPIELFPQIKIINPRIFPYFQRFGLRYCEGRQGRFGFEMKGATNTEELVTILKKTVMIRRLKKDVLEDLPAKRRELIYLSGESINNRMKSLREARDALIKSNKSNSTKDKHESLMNYYVETGIVKAQSVAEQIVESYFYEGAKRRKILIFAHHSIVLDTVTMMVARKGVKYIRIDGGTPQKERGRLCDRFQTDDDVLVAVLSITAAGVGITLTAASVVVFAELHWNPGSMIQAEDRAHRVGQRDSVLVQYMLAKNTADDDIWPLVQKKLKMLGSVDLSNDSYKDAENLHRDVSDRAITSYFARLGTVIDGTKKEGVVDADELEIVDVKDVAQTSGKYDSASSGSLYKYTNEKLPAKRTSYDENDDDDGLEELLNSSVNYNNEINQSAMEGNDSKSEMNVTNMSRCGGFDLEDDNDQTKVLKKTKILKINIKNEEIEDPVEIAGCSSTEPSPAKRGRRAY